jgi:hypothetical protein
MAFMGNDSGREMTTKQAKKLLHYEFEIDSLPSKAEQERLHQQDLRQVEITLDRALVNLAQMELMQKQDKDSAGLIDLYTERTRKTQETVGETDEQGFPSLDLYAQKQKLHKRANGSL